MSFLTGRTSHPVPVPVLSLPGRGYLRLHRGRRGPRAEKGVQEMGHQGGQRGQGNIGDGEATECSQDLRLQGRHQRQQGRLSGGGGGQGGGAGAHSAENSNLETEGRNKDLIPEETAGWAGGQMAGGSSHQESLSLSDYQITTQR